MRSRWFIAYKVRLLRVSDLLRTLYVLCDLGKLCVWGMPFARKWLMLQGLWSLTMQWLKYLWYSAARWLRNILYSTVQWLGDLWSLTVKWHRDLWPCDDLGIFDLWPCDDLGIFVFRRICPKEAIFCPSVTNSTSDWIILILRRDLPSFTATISTSDWSSGLQGSVERLISNDDRPFFIITYVNRVE